MDQEESRILEALDLAVRSEAIRCEIDAIVEQKMRERPMTFLTCEPIPPRLLHCSPRRDHPVELVFILRDNRITGVELHPNSHQRMMSYRVSGDFQTRPGGERCSNLLTSDPRAPIAERWISIPRMSGTSAVVPSENWVVVSFKTAAEHKLIALHWRIDCFAVERIFMTSLGAVEAGKVRRPSLPIPAQDPRAHAS